MSWATNLPNELNVQPLPLIVLTGLDIKLNVTHKEIWDGFSVRSNQKYRYKLLDGAYEYPKPKPKRPVEFNIPKGVLKTHWLNKHLFVMPSVVIVFFELDWDEPNWKEKQMECATKVELIRQSLYERNTRLMLILIQKHPSIPIDADNVLARERYPALCNACQIKNNYLFLLHVEFLHGYIMKLEEEAFSEPTQTYYTLEIKAVKLKRDSLIKVTHQLLLVRLSIKIAFFNEMKNDTFKAIEYYKQAYLSLLDIRIYATNILEIKTIAMLINYKLCKLLFDIRHPIDAIEQFRRHVDIFKIKVGTNELQFEHAAWLSKQFELMGQLFEAAIEKGFPTAVQTQHPGFYFHSAANHTIKRREHLLRELNSKAAAKDESAMPPMQLQFNQLEFYGQRPWRQGLQGMEIFDQQKERDGVLCLQEIESKENLTPHITDLFKQAIKHFRVFNCKRMKQYLSVCMAEEFYRAKDYHESLNIYVKVLNEYHNEHWWPIITSIMFNALKCAYLIADITNYCLLCTELIGKNILLSNADKVQIQENLIRVINNRAPIAEYHQIDAQHHSIENATRLWQIELEKTPNSDDADASVRNMDTSQLLSSYKIIPAHVSGMVPFVECKVRFSAPVFNLSQHCELTVYLRANCVQPIQFDRLSVRFNLSHYNQFCVLNRLGSNLLVEPNRVYAFRFAFLPQKNDLNKELEIGSIGLELGDKESTGRCLVLHWKGDCRNALGSEQQTLLSFNNLKSSLNKANSVFESVEWHEIKVLPACSLISRKANVQVRLEHEPPILIDEFYPIRVVIVNQEENSIKNLSISVELQSANEADGPMNAKTNRVWIRDIDKNVSNTRQTLQLSSSTSIDAGQSLCELVYVQTNVLKSVIVSIKLEYNNENNVPEALNSAEIDPQNINRQLSSDSLQQQQQQKQQQQINIKRYLIECNCAQEETLRLEASQPFRIDFSLMSMQMKLISSDCSVRLNEPFLLLCDVRNQTPYSLKLVNSHLKTLKNVFFKTSESSNRRETCEESDSFLKGVNCTIKKETLNKNETGTECFCLLVDEDKENPKNLNASDTKCIKMASIGDYCLVWKRRRRSADSDEVLGDDDGDDEGQNDLLVRTTVPLPELTVDFFPFYIRAHLPAYACLNETVAVAYTIENRLETQTLELECSLNENEYFSLSGKKLELMQILPHDSTEFRLVLLPLQVGYCKLPQFNIKLSNYNLASANNNTIKLDAAAMQADYLQDGIQNMLPSQLFVFPEKVTDEFLLKLD